VEHPGQTNIVAVRLKRWMAEQRYQAVLAVISDELSMYEGLGWGSSLARGTPRARSNNVTLRQAPTAYGTAWRVSTLAMPAFCAVLATPQLPSCDRDRPSHPLVFFGGW
jgi:hypothetical protein